MQRYNKLLKSGILMLDLLYIICSRNKFVEPANESPLTVSDRLVYLAKIS